MPSLYLPSWMVSESSFFLPFQVSLFVGAAAKAFVIYSTRIAPPDGYSRSSNGAVAAGQSQGGARPSNLKRSGAKFLNPQFLAKLSKLSDATQEVSADLDHLSNIEFDSFRGHDTQIELLRSGMTKLMMQTFFEDNLENMVQQPDSPQ